MRDGGSGRPGSADSVVVALAGDAMLGRRVASAISSPRAPPLFSSEVEEAVRTADFFVLNLECCISDRGSPWPAPGKPFFFRAPPRAAELLARSGVDCVTLANNHALDFGAEALLDTIKHLSAAGIRYAGAGPDVSTARAPALLEHRSFRLAVVAAADHPADFAATAERPGVAFADLRSRGVPEWLFATAAAAHAQTDAVLFSPHWGPNLTARPPAHVRAAAAEIAPRVTLVAGHSAHAFHGVGGNVIYDLGDFVNDYESVRPARNVLAGIRDKLRKEIGGLGSEVQGAVRRRGAGRIEAGIPITLWQLQRRRVRRIASMIRARTMRPDLGLLFLATIDRAGLRRLEALPLKIGHCHTRLAAGAEADFVHRRFRRACAALGTQAIVRDGRSVIVWR
jgi:poly-gamma-glutamate capsule biosynthesis protein CapA/YwtB (metallophosphatase superfamily)